ncbi:hypothetical protein Chro_0822 [Chroococcidiopsis thermalis PCC 7203]|uniref:Uncharacterized protein n=1 Tax=Chroococcidiopsis thermalis (strain PCC 7203) TaxID=251229 RepID=K9TVF5_CHRTP|nr:hypothetical protein Chro_0822 [Chroococcidiopsis thermalis PCC 7203]
MNVEQARSLPQARSLLYKSFRTAIAPRRSIISPCPMMLAASRSASLDAMSYTQMAIAEEHQRHNYLILERLEKYFILQTVQLSYSLSCDKSISRYRIELSFLLLTSILYARNICVKYNIELSGRKEWSCAVREGKEQMQCW